MGRDGKEWCGVEWLRKTREREKEECAFRNSASVCGGIVTHGSDLDME